MIENCTYEAIIKVRLYSEEEGGRKSPIRTHRYGCPLFFKGKGYDCRFLKTEKSLLQLGEEHEIPIKFLNPELVLYQIYEGAKIQLWEGKIIGEGVILKISQAHLK